MSGKLRLRAPPKVCSVLCIILFGCSLMCVYVYAHMCVRVYMCACVRAHVHVRVCVCACMCARVHVCVFAKESLLRGCKVPSTSF